MKLLGTVHIIKELQRVSERFSKREFVLETRDNPRYPQLILFQATGDKIQELDNVRAGDELEVEFELRGREWTSPKGEVKYFTTLDVYKIHRSRQGRADDRPREPNHGRPAGGNGTSDDDIPF